MTQVPDVQNEPLAPLDEAAPQTPGPTAQTPGDAELQPAGQFGTLKQDALNRWTVRDRET